MPGNACVCRSCVDPREHGFFIQHGIPLSNGLYMARCKGGFVPKPSPTHDISTTGLMLVQMDNAPNFVLQGHRDCAAVRILYGSQGKIDSEMNETEKEFRRSHLKALNIVLNYATALDPEQSLRLLEKLCVLQSINNSFEYDSFRQNPNYKPAFHAYYSITPKPSETPPSGPEKMGLMIFDPEQSVFASTGRPHDNHGLRIADLIDLAAFVPYDHDSFKLTAPVDLEIVARNESRYVIAGATPNIEDPEISSYQGQSPATVRASGQRPDTRRCG